MRTNVLQKSRPTEILFHALPNCKAKSTLQLSSINTNGSTSVEHNSKTLAQNQFNSRQPIQKSNGLRPAPKQNYFYSSRLSSRLKLSLSRLLRLSFVVVSRLSAIERAYIYIHKSQMTTNLLVYAGLNLNPWRERYA